MPTDKERREVARRLRGLRGGWSSGECYYTIINALGWPDRSRDMGGHALYAALADLINPDVDRDALLALAEEMQGELDECADDHEIAGKLQYQIDRIREACGGR